MEIFERSNGVTPYYRTLPNGGETPCGVRLDINQTPSDIVGEMIRALKGKISLTLIFDKESPFSYTPEDLGKSPHREKILNEIAEAARAWCNAIIIMKKGPGNISRRPK